MNAQVIIEKLVANNGRYMDDHVHYGDPVRTCSGYMVVGRGGAEYVCPLHNEPQGPVKALYIAGYEGELRLSVWSIGLHPEGKIDPSIVEVKDVVWFDQAA